MSTLALLVLMMLGPALAHSSCVRWEGTITSDAGMSGIFRAVARVPPPVLPGAVAAGPFHCRGPGCPGRHGLFTDTYLFTEVEVAGQFEPASRKLICYYIGPAIHPPSIDASYECYSLPGKTTFLFGGMLHLSGHRCHP